MNKIFALVNDNWKKIFNIFNIEVLENKDGILNYKEAILLISEDKKSEIKDIEDKIEKREIIVTELPANENSKLEIEEIEKLINKVLGISTKK